MKIINQILSAAIIFSMLVSGTSIGIAQEINLPQKGICAHRGAMDTHPENTLPAFEEAIRLGVQMIELDVRLTKDKRLVIMHDESVDRTTDGSGMITGLTFNYLKELDAGSWKSSAFKNVKVPTLAEALEVMPKNIWLNVHLKGGEELGRKVAKEIVAAERVRQAFLACGAAAARGAREVNKEIMVCNMERQDRTEDYVNQTIKSSSQFIQLYKVPVNPEIEVYTTKLKQNDIKINYCCTDSPEEVEKLLEYGVDFVLVNKPQSILKRVSFID